MKFYYTCVSCEQLIPTLEYCKCQRGQEKKQEHQDFDEAFRKLDKEFPGAKE